MSRQITRRLRLKSRLSLLAATAFLGWNTAAPADILSLPAFHVLAENCAPSVAPDIMEKIVRAESGFDRFAIGVNGANLRSYSPDSREEAARIARDLIAQGHSIDMGLGQINSNNLDWLDLTVDTVFESCSNLAAAEDVLRDGYDRARDQGSDPQTALHQALSAYNTGTFTRGFSNGYVERVMGADVAEPHTNPSQSANISAPPDTTPVWDVFSGGTASSSYVFN
ncbi:lytic transglycosylase domain-containing protein [Sedimentitalea sp.]|uniref:lytic transglycosylase domain-containing protein n=1 Tax=Sedimentitalea sp. TaxID=2048915 RepID=UPI003296B937